MHYILNHKIAEEKQTESFYKAAESVFGAFDKTLHHSQALLPDGVFDGKTLHESAYLYATGRNIAQAKAHELALLCVEDVSFYNHMQAKRRLDSDASLRGEINRLLKEQGMRYDSDSKVVHFLEVLEGDIGFETFAKKCESTFEGFTIGIYYGKDRTRTNQFVDTGLAAQLIAACGGKPKILESASRFSGYEVHAHIPMTAYRAAGEILCDAVDSGCDLLMMTNAPGFYMCDQHYPKIEETVARECAIPVVTPVQLAALALGERDVQKLGFANHKIPATFL